MPTKKQNEKVSGNQNAALYRYSDTNTHTDNLTLAEAREFKRLQNGGRIERMPHLKIRWSNVEADTKALQKAVEEANAPRKDLVCRNVPTNPIEVYNSLASPGADESANAPRSDIPGYNWNHPDWNNIGGNGLEEIRNLVRSYSVADILDAISHFMVEIIEEEPDAADCVTDSIQIVAHASKCVKC